MTEWEYYDLPLNTADRLELQNFLISDHSYGLAKTKYQPSDPQSTQEIFSEWGYKLGIKL